MKREAQEAGAALAAAPRAAASALGTAGEIVGGVASHAAGRAKELAHNVATHGDVMSPEERAAKGQVGRVAASRAPAQVHARARALTLRTLPAATPRQAAVARVEANMQKLGDVATDHRAVQVCARQGVRACQAGAAAGQGS